MWPILSDDKGSLWLLCRQHTFWDYFKHRQKLTFCLQSSYIPSVHSDQEQEVGQ